jgi:hypothetical protein
VAAQTQLNSIYFVALHVSADLGSSSFHNWPVKPIKEEMCIM